MKRPTTSAAPPRHSHCSRGSRVSSSARHAPYAGPTDGGRLQLEMAHRAVLRLTRCLAILSDAQLEYLVSDETAQILYAQNHTGLPFAHKPEF